MKNYDYLIVGAGFAGCTLAERLANAAGKTVLLIDKRNHIGGNAYDYYDDNGILVHKYGPHIFHTNSSKVYRYLSQFTPWRNYQHRVLASVDGRFVPMPINLDTINSLYGTRYSQEDVQAFYERVRESSTRIENSRDVIVQKVGTELYEKFFKNYTKKQWDLWPEELSPSVCARIPIRTNRDDRYFTDVYQVMPAHGYTKMFEKMIASEKIHLMLGVDYRDVQAYVGYDSLIYTGPIDQYFDYRFGKLPYRSLKFVHEVHDETFLQPVGTINYPNEYEFTRVTEMKHLTGQVHQRSVLVYEHPVADGDPYYPIPTQDNQDLYQKYVEAAAELGKVHFVGRLGTYKYYNMDQVVAQALTTFEKLLNA